MDSLDINKTKDQIEKIEKKFEMEDRQDEKLEEKVQMIDKFERQGVTLEEALQKTGFGKFNYMFIFICGIIFMSYFFELVGVGYYLPVAECDLGITSKQDYATINAFANIGIFLSYHLWGCLADVKGRRKILLITMTIALIFTVLTSITESFWLFAVLRLLNGFFVSTSSHITFSYMAEFHSEKYRSLSIMLSSSMTGFIGFFLPLCGYLFVNMEWSFYIPIIDLIFRSWRLYVLFLGSPALISVICLWYLPESPKFVYNTGDSQETIRILKNIYYLNTGRKDYDVEEIDDPEFGIIKDKSASAHIYELYTKTKTLFNKTYCRSTLIVCYLQFGALAFGISMLIFYPKILQGHSTYMDLNPGDYSLSLCEIQDYLKVNVGNVSETVDLICNRKMPFSSFGYPLITETTYFLGFLAMGFLVKYFSMWTLSNVVFLCCAAASFGLIFSTVPTLSNVLYLILLLCGLSSNMIGTATVDLYPTHIRSTAVGISMLVGRLGTVLGINLIGFLFSFNCQLIFIIVGVTFICSTLAPYFLKSSSQNIDKNGEVVR